MNYYLKGTIKNGTKRIALFCIFSLFVFYSLSSQTYFIDSENGDDINGNGSQAAPFKSLSNVWDSLKGGETLKLYNGNYGSIYQNFYKDYIHHPIGSV